MNYTETKTANSPIFLSEISSLTLKNNCLNCFKLNHQVSTRYSLPVIATLKVNISIFSERPSFHF